ncbi:hypothetical protein C8R45DRAFT_1078564 [Mycena sanguinolenta]|nr:hypothetical protein C8R45DRAFT_1078564 [Mycena sanguinolenta]
MPADGQRRKSPQLRASTSDRRTIVNHISGGRGGHGGHGHPNGSGGAGGNGMGPALNFDISAGSLTMNNIQNGERGIELLHRSVALAAIHDSVESFPQPRCHPETRTKMLKGLGRWALDGMDLGSDMHWSFDLNSDFESLPFRLDGPADPECRIIWLYGPAGAGKSAIMQTLAGQLQDANRLGGCFFFKRGHDTRGNAQTLFATIAYQLALNVEWLRTPISEIVENNPSVVVRSIATQMKMLISDPCGDHANRDSVTILIDGLDECEGQDTQMEILRAIRNACNPSITLRFIVASRLEEHIREMFHSPFYSGCYHSVNVEQSFKDVRKYLRDQFSRIHREHHIMASVPQPWPSPDVVDKLVQKSSGYFLYAATIIKFIDDKSHRPTRRLAIIIDGSQGSESAFDTLDQLYMTILSSAPRQAELVLILCAIVKFDLNLRKVDQLFELEDGEAGLILRGLHSVLYVPRSHHFYVGNLDHRMAVAQSFLRLGASGRYQPVWSHLQSRSPWDRFPPFLISLPPSPELCPLIRSMDPDCIFSLLEHGFGDMLSWLKKIPSAPQDLIELWEDYVFMCAMGRDHTTCIVKHILSPSSQLCKVLVATVFTRLWVRDVRRLLAIEWTEFRTIMCSIRLNIAGETEQVLRGLPQDVVHALVPPEMQQTAFRELAGECIHRVIKCHDDGMDDANSWLVP